MILEVSPNPADWQVNYNGVDWAFQPLTPRACDWLKLYQDGNDGTFLFGNIYVANGHEQPLLKLILLQGHSVALPMPITPAKDTRS